MKKFLFYALIMVIILSACSEKQEKPVKERTAVIPKSAVTEVLEQTVNIKISNMTAADIYEIYVGPAGTQGFGNDILGNNILPKNETAEVFFVKAESYETLDVKALADDGKTYIWQGVKFDSLGTLELYINNGETTFTVKE